MAQVALIREPRDYGAELYDQGGVSVLFDATIAEEPHDSAKVPDHPLEDGTSIAEHYQRMPTTLNLTAEMTDTPIWDEDPEPNRAVNAYDVLMGYMDRAELVTVVTGLRVYESMVVVDVAPKHDLTTGQSIEFAVSLKQIKRVTPEFVRALDEWLADDVADSGADETDTGRNNGEEDGEMESVAYDLNILGLH